MAGFDSEFGTIVNTSTSERDKRKEFYGLFKNSPLPEKEMLANLGLYTNRQALSRILFMHEMYQQIINVHGIVVEFGVRWGQNLSLFSSFRGMYEPYNYGRRIVGFDTFSGFPSVAPEDGTAEVATVGNYDVTENYEQYLDQVLAYHESESPISHMKKYELIKGDATVTLEQYLEKHPETIIALAYFDFDIYEPTKKCLSLIKKHLTKGSVLGFDELNYPAWPGETIAVREELGLSTYSIRRSPHGGPSSYLVIE